MFLETFLKINPSLKFILTFAFQYYNHSVAKPTDSGTITGTHGKHSAYDNVHKYIERLDHVSPFLTCLMDWEKIFSLKFQYGKRRLTVDVDYKRVPLGYKYLEQYHGFKHPLAGTEIYKSGWGYNNKV